ncbi:MAG: imidazoleglycerol-phosphate dehydratase HisB [bacterium]|jgi:imidazoleglycerol-phosphate dehydratase
MTRQAEAERKTKETAVRVRLALDGKGAYEVATGIPFFDHMLSLFAKHGLFNLTVEASGDIEVDYHHTVEDVGIVLGQAIREAVGDKAGIRRYGQATVPMVESLATCVLDCSGRANLVYRVDAATEKVGQFDMELVEEFFRALATEAGLDLHLTLHYGSNTHHIIEALFKSFARALDAATSMDPRVKGVPSTKGTL